MLSATRSYVDNKITSRNLQERSKKREMLKEMQESQQYGNKDRDKNWNGEKENVTLIIHHVKFYLWSVVLI